MPFNCCGETSFTEMCRCGYFGMIFWHAILASTSVCLHRNAILVCSCPTSGFRRHPRTVSIRSYQQQCQQCTLFCNWLKKFSMKEMSDVTSYTDWAYRTVSWSQNRNWKSSFIMHAHYMQLTISEGRVSVWPSASAATRKVMSASICWRVKSLQTHLHISGHSLPLHLYHNIKKMCVKIAINEWLK